MMDEGALTYITKDTTRRDLKIAFEKAAKGEMFYFGQIDNAEQNLLIPDKPTEKINISPTQLDIAKLLSEGLTHKEIADRIGINRSFVEKMLKTLRATFKVKNNIELVRLLTRLGSI